MRVKRTHCKYCGARLKRDPDGQLCPTRNCQWQHGLPKSEDSPRDVYRLRKPRKPRVKT